jgi:glycine/D-amino acid oxidase-like deaminating enzyme
MSGAVPGERWAAVDGCTPDRRPIIGEHPDLAGLFVHAGGNFKGFKIAPAASQALVDEIVRGRAADSPIAAFSPARFGKPAEPEDADRQYTGARWT